MACVVRRRSQNYAAVKASHRAFTTVGRRNSWKPGKKRLADDTARAASTGEVKTLQREAHDLKEVVAEQTLELRLLKKSMIADGGDIE